MPASLLAKLPSINATLPGASKWTVPEDKIEPRYSTRLQPLIDSIPLIYSSIQDVNDSGDDEKSPVVLVQDVHLNDEAQLNIASVLQELIDQKKIALVGVEGTVGAFDFTALRAAAGEEIRRPVAEDFLKKDMLAAPSYVGITSEVEPPLFFGIDDPAHYKANVDAYLSSRDKKEKVAAELASAKAGLIERKRRVFSAELSRFDNLRISHQKGDIAFGVYVQKLEAYSPTLDWAVAQFIEAYRMESSLNFNRVENERGSLIKKLATKLTEQEVSELMATSLAYRMGRVGFGAYYEGIKTLCERKGVSLRDTPAFENYVRYVLLSDGINADALFEGVRKMEREIIARLARSKGEKELMDAGNALALKEKIVDFSLTPQEWEEYNELKNVPVANGVDLSSFESFYSEADARSHTMVNTLVERPAPSGAGKVIVAGGFHTAMMSRLLREKNIRYAVVSPKITKVDGSPSVYLSVFDREKTPLDRLFAGEKLFLNSAHLAIGNPSEPASQLPEQFVLATLLVEAKAKISGTQPEETVQSADGTKYEGVYDPGGRLPGVRFHNTVFKKVRGSAFSALKSLLHPLVSPFTETAALWGTVAVVADPTGFSSLAAAFIIVVFAIAHPDLWRFSKYRAGKFDPLEFLSRFTHRLVGGFFLILPFMFMADSNGALLSGVIHGVWNVFAYSTGLLFPLSLGGGKGKKGQRSLNELVDALEKSPGVKTARPVLERLGAANINEDERENAILGLADFLRNSKAKPSDVHREALAYYAEYALLGEGETSADREEVVKLFRKYGAPSLQTQEPAFLRLWHVALDNLETDISEFIRYSLWSQVAAESGNAGIDKLIPRDNLSSDKSQQVFMDIFKFLSDQDSVEAKWLSVAINGLQSNFFRKKIDTDILTMETILFNFERPISDIDTERLLEISLWPNNKGVNLRDLNPALVAKLTRWKRTPIVSEREANRIFNFFKTPENHTLEGALLATTFFRLIDYLSKNEGAFKNERIGLLADLRDIESVQPVLKIPPAFRSEIQESLISFCGAIVDSDNQMDRVSTMGLFLLVSLIESAETRQDLVRRLIANEEYSSENYPSLLASPLLLVPEYVFLRVHLREVAEIFKTQLNSEMYRPTRLEYQSSYQAPAFDQPFEEIVAKLIDSHPEKWEDAVLAHIIWIFQQGGVHWFRLEKLLATPSLLSLELLSKVPDNGNLFSMVLNYHYNEFYPDYFLLSGRTMATAVDTFHWTGRSLKGEIEAQRFLSEKIDDIESMESPQAGVELTYDPIGAMAWLDTLRSLHERGAAIPSLVKLVSLASYKPVMNTSEGKKLIGQILEFLNDFPQKDVDAALVLSLANLSEGVIRLTAPGELNERRYAAHEARVAAWRIQFLLGHPDFKALQFTKTVDYKLLNAERVAEILRRLAEYLAAQRAAPSDPPKIREAARELWTMQLSTIRLISGELQDERARNPFRPLNLPADLKNELERALNGTSALTLPITLQIWRPILSSGLWRSFYRVFTFGGVMPENLDRFIGRNIAPWFESPGHYFPFFLPWHGYVTDEMFEKQQMIYSSTWGGALYGALASLLLTVVWSAGMAVMYFVSDLPHHSVIALSMPALLSPMLFGAWLGGVIGHRRSYDSENGWGALAFSGRAPGVMSTRDLLTLADRNGALNVPNLLAHLVSVSEKDSGLQPLSRENINFLVEGLSGKHGLTLLYQRVVLAQSLMKMVDFHLAAIDPSSVNVILHALDHFFEIEQHLRWPDIQNSKILSDLDGLEALAGYERLTRAIGWKTNTEARYVLLDVALHRLRAELTRKKLSHDDLDRYILALEDQRPDKTLSKEFAYVEDAILRAIPNNVFDTLHGNSDTFIDILRKTSDNLRLLIAQDMAKRLIELAKTRNEPPAVRIVAIEGLIQNLKIFGEPNGQGDTAVSWRETESALRTELAKREFDPELVANLAFFLRFILSDREYDGFIGSIENVPNRSATPEVRGTVSWVSDIAQVRKLTSKLKENDSLVVGLDVSKNPSLKKKIESDPELSELVASGRLGVVEGKNQSTVLDLVNQARQSDVFEGRNGLVVNVLILEGVPLPDNFFGLTPEQRRSLQRLAVVYYVNQALQAFEVDASLLPDWNELRTRLLQA